MGLVVLSCILVLVGITLSLISKKIDGRIDEGAKLLFKVIGICLIVAGPFIFTFSTFTIIDYGNVGVQVTFGTVNPVEYPMGFCMVNPMSNIIEYNVQTRQVEKEFTTETIDTQAVTVPVIMNITPNPNYVAENIQTIGIDYISIILNRAIQEAVRGEVAKHKIADLVKERPNVRSRIENELRSSLEEYNIVLNELTLGEFDFSEEYDRAIERKQLEEQKADQRLYELRQHQTEAQSQVAKAKGLADSAIEEARGKAESIRLAATAEAESLRIRGEAQAEYNKKVSESLSPMLIQHTYLTSWNGTLPTHMFSSNPGITMMIPGDK